MRNPICLLSATLILSTPAASLAQGWIEYLSQEDRFGVNFPGEPDIEAFEYQSEFNAVFPARVYTVESGGNRFSATVVDFTDSAQIHAAKESTEAASGPFNWLYDQRASVARAAREFRERGGEVTYDAWSHIDRVEGHQLQLTNADGTRTFAGIYLNGHVNRLYVLEATVAAGSPAPALFQQSLRFLDEDDQRIRYLLSTTGCAIDPSTVVR